MKGYVRKKKDILKVEKIENSKLFRDSKKIDTYETSILPFEDCCTIFVPEHPVINPNLDKCITYETLIDYETKNKYNII